MNGSRKNSHKNGTHDAGDTKDILKEMDLLLNEIVEESIQKKIYFLPLSFISGYKKLMELDNEHKKLFFINIIQKYKKIKWKPGAKVNEIFSEFFMGKDPLDSLSVLSDILKKLLNLNIDFD